MRRYRHVAVELLDPLEQATQCAQRSIVKGKDKLGVDQDEDVLRFHVVRRARISIDGGVANEVVRFVQLEFLAGRVRLNVFRGERMDVEDLHHKRHVSMTTIPRDQ